MSSSTPDDDRTVIRPSISDDDERTVIRPRSSVEPLPPVIESGHHNPRGNGESNAASSAGDSGNALPVGTFLTEFELTSVLGEGGFGIVYLAWDHSLERRVALKEYMPAALSARVGTSQVQVKSARHRETFDLGLKSFVNEAKLLASFDHPSLVKVYRFWEANGTAYMVMPFYEGITLKDKLRELGEPPDEAWLMAMLAPLTEALAVIHAENCFHRDIAPDNVILLASTGKPLLLDFGAARRVIGDMTQALTVILKPGYAPVEQYAEAPNMKQGAWTDVYALAATMHFAIHGRTPPTSVGRLMSDNYIALAESAAGRYRSNFLQALDQALAVRPEDRTQSIAALRSDLGLSDVLPLDEQTRFSGAAGGRHEALSADAKKPRVSRGLWLGLGAVLLLAAGIGGYAAFKPSPVAAPATASLPAEPVVIPASLNMLDEFDKVLAARTAGFDVEALPDLPQIRISKDDLGFKVKSSRDGFVSVLMLDPGGGLIQIFPNKMSENLGSSRIKAGEIMLPMASLQLSAQEPTGTEHFLVIVSQEMRDYSALSTEIDDYFLKLPTKEAAAAKARQWSRNTPLLLGAAVGCNADCDKFGAVRFQIEVVR